MKKVNTKKITESAVLLALGYILSMIKIKINPNGGSITLASMLPIVMLAYKYGPAWGTLCGTIHGMLQMIEGGIAAPPTENALSYFTVIMLDYIVAWAMVGLLGGLVMKLIENPRVSITVGSFVGIFGRFLSSFLSGAIIWGVYAPEGQSPWLYSLVVNGLGMLPEMVITSLVAFILFSFSSMRNLLRPQIEEGTV